MTLIIVFNVTMATIIFATGGSEVIATANVFSSLIVFALLVKGLIDRGVK
jgi:hypothetical protein